MRYADNPIPGMNQNLNKLGPTFGGYIGGLYPSIVTTDPDFIRHVLQKNHRNYHKSFLHFEKLAYFLGKGLLTSDGDYWLKQRRLIQPGFHRQRLEGLTQIMLKVIDEFLVKFDQKIKEGPIDIYTEMMELAFEIIARSLFGKAIKRQDLQVLSNNLTEIQTFVVQQIRQPYLHPWLKCSGKIKRHKQLAEQSEAIILKYIRERKNAATPGNDLLQMLLDARYHDNGEEMTERQLLDEINILLEAGHETSANALCWTWHLLSQHPETIARLREELQDVLGNKVHPSFEDLKRLTYSRQVIQESMRLFPPAWVTNRITATDDIFEGIKIPKGTIMVLYIYGVHHSHKYWRNPESFDPDRFGPDQNLAHAYAYLPFGNGPRLCIGNNFALMEMQLVLAQMLRRYQVQPITDQQIDLQPLITLRPKSGILLNINSEKF
ncbi:MAG: cytochrome P450 [Saprospiraceae bacterium]|nr:MAG: cytochrome P450 [Saprospiraceae bacterium]